jgi:hypothetical protein
MPPHCSEGFVVGAYEGARATNLLRIVVEPITTMTFASENERLSAVARALHSTAAGPNGPILPCNDFNPPAWKPCSSCKRTHMTNTNAFRCVEFIVRSERNDVDVTRHYYASPGKWEYGRNRYVYENICTDCVHAYVRWVRNTRPFVCFFRFVEDDRTDYARRRAMWKFACRTISFQDYCQICDQLSPTTQPAPKPALLSASALLAVKATQFIPPTGCHLHSMHPVDLYAMSNARPICPTLPSTPTTSPSVTNERPVPPEPMCEVPL